MGGGQSFPRVQLRKEQVVIVTGGNTGIGYETAKWIAMLGATVIIACRSKERANAAIQRMHEDFEKEKKKFTSLTDELSVEFMKVDLTSLKSVMNFIQEFKSSGRKLQTLVCNAGIGSILQTYTEDDNEMIFQVNYLSQFLIAAHFLPIMLKTGGDCRIVLVSSAAHAMAHFDIETIQGKKYNRGNFPGLDYYGRSKIYQIMQMYSMNRRLKNSNVTVTSLHPGLVNTEIGRAFDGRCCASCCWDFLLCCCCSKNPYQGAETSINAVVNPKYEGERDLYFQNCKPIQPKNNARNETYQEQLWQFTLDLLKDYLTDEIIEYLEGKKLHVK